MRGIRTVLKITALVILVLAGLAAILLYKGDIPASEVDAKYSNEASQFLTLENGSRIHYRDQGNPDGEPLVLIHGSNASLHAWEPWVAELGDEYRIVTLDLPGHGLTGAVPSRDYSTEAYVGVVAAVTQALGLPEFVLGGNSMGGGVTWRYALTHPDTVRAMILVDATGPFSWSREAMAREDIENAGKERETPLAFSLMRQPAFRALARHLDPAFLVEQGLRSAYYRQDVVTPELITQYYELALREGTRAATMDRFAGFRPGQTEEVNLQPLTMPTLILWGQEDSLISTGVANRFSQELPVSQLIIYPEVGHLPMEEIPAQTASDVRNFLHGLSVANPSDSDGSGSQAAPHEETAH
ncbi:MAG: alpha/beta hydrolase [Pseudomonadales bacterium]|nr:alpha/beta hydrolase [Pseudomonadales bacterium]